MKIDTEAGTRERRPDRVFQPHGGAEQRLLLIITAIVEDPQYLNVPFIRSTHFKMLDTSTCQPEACSAKH